MVNLYANNNWEKIWSYFAFQSIKQLMLAGLGVEVISNYSRLPDIRTPTYSKFSLTRSKDTFPLDLPVRQKLPQLFELSVIRSEFLSPLELRITGSPLYSLFVRHNSEKICLVGTAYNIYQMFGLDGRP